jgi:cell division protein FtsA
LELVQVAASLGANRQADEIIGLLDIGNSKTVCLIVAAPMSGRKAHGARVLGVGVQPTRGLKAGVVVALDEAEQAVRAAVAQAERVAGVRVEEVFLSVACGRLKSSTFAANTEIEGRVVSSADIERLMAAARTHVERDGRTLLHMNCISYRLDSAVGIGEPLGLAGRTLGADLHSVTADEAPLHNLLQVVERAYLSAAGLVPAPYGSGLAATTEEERQLGVVAIDIGAGTTTLAAFARGHLLSTDVVPVGGNHATLDLAQTLSASAYEAERIKMEYGTLARAVSDDHELVAYVLAGEDAATRGQTTKGEVRAVVRSRMLRLFGHMAGRIERSGVAPFVMQRMVLTGGGSQLVGLGEFAADFFARPVRVARIEPLDGMPAGFDSPAFSTSIGLIYTALDPSAGTRENRGGLEAGGYLQRMGQWLREGF